MPEVIWLHVGGAIAGFCTTGIILVLFAAVRSRYLLWMAGGMFVLALQCLAYVAHAVMPSPQANTAFLSLLVISIVMLSRGFDEFLGEPPSTLLQSTGLAGAVMSAALVYAGYAGAAFMLTNLVCALVISQVFVRNRILRDQAWHVMISVTTICTLSILGFVARAVMVALQGNLSAGSMPQNWAEVNIAGFSIVAGTALGPIVMSLNAVRTQVQLRTEAITDPLTGILNRRALTAFYEDFTFDPLSAVVIFDLDHFKKVNDSYGHAVGDDVLRAFADILRNETGTSVDAFRLGGEEFALVFKRAAHIDVMRQTEMVRRRFELHLTDTEKGAIRATTSAGICLGGADRTSLTDMLKGADAALYAAKDAGRNRTVTLGRDNNDPTPALMGLRKAV